MEPEKIGTRDATAGSGLSYSTLKKYVLRGWIEAPEKISRGRKTGVQLLWSVEIISAIRTIQLLKKSGLNPSQISMELDKQKIIKEEKNDHWKNERCRY